MMATDISNEVNPDRLEVLVIAAIGRNLIGTICCQDGQSVRLRDGISLPPVISDRMFNQLVSSLELDPMQKSPAHDKLIEYCRIFSDNRRCKLRRIALNRAPLSDDLVQALAYLAERHPLLEIDLSASSDMNGDDNDTTPPYNHSILLPGFLLESCGKSLQKLTMTGAFMAYSVNQIMMFSGKKAKALGRTVYLTSDATLESIPLCVFKGNAPVLSSLDLTESFNGWFMSIDPENPPPLKALNLGGYCDIRMNSTVKKFLQHLAYGEEEYVPEKRPRATVAHSKSERKLQKYEFFKRIDPSHPMLEKFLETSHMKKNLEENEKIASDYDAIPKHNYVLTHMNLICLKNTLQYLGLFNSWLSQSDFEDIIFHLKNLEHLDIGWPSEELRSSTRFRPADITVWKILDNLPKLKSLDVSGTYYGEKLSDEAEVVEGQINKKLVMDREREPLNFLGLWGTKSCRLTGLEKLALKISGDSNEEQLLTCLDMYLNKPDIVTNVLSRLSSSLQEGTCERPNLALKLFLKCLNRYPTHSSLLFVCTANLYGLLQVYVQQLSVYQKRDVVRAVTTILERNFENRMLLRNCMVMYFSFDLPGDLLFEFDRISKLVLNIFDKKRDVDEVNIIAGSLCNALVCSTKADVKTQIRKLDYVGVMISIINSRLDTKTADDVLDTAWGALWNVSDETPSNSEDFINKDGLSLFRRCYETFPENNDLIRNMMGLIGNIAEVKYLRPHLAKPDVLQLIVRLVSITASGIEVAYNACGVLSNLLVDDSDILRDVSLDQIRSDMRKSILSWDTEVARNINYRTFDPLIVILRRPGEPVAHLWVLWAIHNLCNRDSNYVSLIIKDGGVGIIKSLKDTSDDQKVVYFAGEIIKKCNLEEGSSV